MDNTLFAEQLTRSFEVLVKYKCKGDLPSGCSRVLCISSLGTLEDAKVTRYNYTEP